MAIRIVKLGSPRKTHEGLRVGTVRRPPRGVPKWFQSVSGGLRLPPAAGLRYQSSNDSGGCSRV
jgi:uncharacterized protein YeaO (DUF488 family)